MNRKLISRWLNEYLDGEIGLADKAELERLMAADPELRREYAELRQLGLQIGALPEIEVHPYRFRRRLAASLESRSVYFTPQRAFAGAMVVALLVVAVSFSLFMFQQKELGKVVTVSRFEPRGTEAALTPQAPTVMLDTGVDADRFFSRLLVESQLGMIDPQALSAVVQQTNVLEGAQCSEDPLNPVLLADENLRLLHLKVAPSIAVQLGKVAEDLCGRERMLNVLQGEAEVPLEDYLRRNPDPDALPLVLSFSR